MRGAAPLCCKFWEQKMRVDGILFDKDGTLFDFRTTWNAWAAKLINLKALCDSAIARQAEAVWRAPERMAL